MLFGLDGVELSLIIVFSTLFLSILSGYPVAFGLSGAARAGLGHRTNGAVCLSGLHRHARFGAWRTCRSTCLLALD